MIRKLLKKNYRYSANRKYRVKRSAGSCSGYTNDEVKDELIRVRQILKAAEMDLTIKGNPEFMDIPPLVENVLSMCLKEAVTNVVKHSYGSELPY